MEHFAFLQQLSSVIPTHHIIQRNQHGIPHEDGCDGPIPGERVTSEAEWHVRKTNMTWESGPNCPGFQMSNPFIYDTGKRSPYGCLGHEVQIEHIKAYVCRPSFFTDKAVIVIHDVFGWQFPDIRYIVDLIAGHGYITICPDFFKGTEPWKSTDHWADFADWMKEHDPMKVDKETDVTLKYLKEQCGAKKIGIAGFSWGGMAAHHLMLKNPQLAAGVSLYGIIRDSEERYDLLNPTFFIFGEKDHTISYDQITLLEDKLKQYCKVAYKIKVYPGQVHGFAQLKPEDMKPEDKPYIEEARKDMIDWIKQFI